MTDTFKADNQFFLLSLSCKHSFNKKPHDKIYLSKMDSNYGSGENRFPRVEKGHINKPILLLFEF